MSNCPGIAVLERYCGGELPEEQERGVDAHIGECGECAGRVGEIRRKMEEVVRRVKLVEWDSLKGGKGEKSEKSEKGGKGGVRIGKLEDGGENEDGSPVGPLTSQGDVKGGHRCHSGGGLPDAGVFEGYEILREIHRGGQGVVYQAVQKSTKRRVAIKVLLEGPYASDAARRRFEREIELVASLKHPNIVAVFDSGRTKDGREYCVMDYVQGERLGEYLKLHRLPLREALRLFRAVCEAISFAHQRGVIHRDLKPWNIVVEMDGQPKVLDFGLAKTMGGAVDPLVSMTGQVVGTMPYLSPEQARGKLDEVDTRTDIYALGVMLYEMLTGMYPYEVRGEVIAVLANIANAEPMALRKAWNSQEGIRAERGDGCPIDDEISTIVLKALSKERERRYQSAGELARDLEHYLQGEAIEAKRDSSWYLVRKTLNRHKTAVRLAGGLVAGVLVFGVWMSVLWSRALDAERLAENRLHETQIAHEAEVKAHQATEAQVGRTKQVAEFLDSTLRAVDPWKHPGRDLGPLREMLDAAVVRLAASFKDQPEVEAAIAGTLGWDYWTLEIYDQAETLLRRSYELNRQTLGDEDGETVMSLNNLATLLTDQGKYAESGELFERLLEIQRRTAGPEHWSALQAMNNLAHNLDWQGRSVEAEGLYRTALEGLTRTLGATDPIRMSTLNNLAVCLPGLGKAEEAEALYRELIECRTKVHGEDHPETMQARMNHAQFLSASGRSGEGVRLLRELLAEMEAKLGPDHPLSIVTMTNLAGALSNLGQLEEGLVLSRRAYEAQAALAGADHPTTLMRKSEYVATLIEMRRWEEAIPLGQALKEQYARMLGEGHLLSLTAAGNLAYAFNQSGWRDAAEKLWKQVIATGEGGLGATAGPVVTARANLGALYADEQRWAEAETAFRAAIAAQVELNEGGHWRTAWMRAGLGRVLMETGRLDEAERELSESVPILRESLGEDHDKTRRAGEYLERLKEKRG